MPHLPLSLFFIVDEVTAAKARTRHGNSSRGRRGILIIVSTGAGPQTLGSLEIPCYLDNAGGIVVHVERTDGGLTVRLTEHLSVETNNAAVNALGAEILAEGQFNTYIRHFKRKKLLHVL